MTSLCSCDIVELVKYRDLKFVSWGACNGPARQRLRDFTFSFRAAGQGLPTHVTTHQLDAPVRLGVGTEGLDSKRNDSFDPRVTG